MNRSRALIASLLLAVASIPALGQGHRFQPGFNLFSKQQDMQLGEESAAQVRKQMTVVNDPVLTEYVNRVGKRLASAKEAQDSGFPFTFEVVAEPSINAFALPGGHMFIHTGLLKAVESESQLAGVMGHEMSHVILRHGTNQASKRNLFELPAMLASKMSGNSSMLGQLTQLGIGLGANSVLLGFSRNAESQADLMGSHLMSESGYDPVELAHFFSKLNSPSKGVMGSVTQFLSDHPNPDHREAAIERESRLLGEHQYGYETGQFKHMKEVVAKIHEPAPKPKQPEAQPQQKQ